MTCFYRLEEGVKPALHSDPSTVTVLDLRKPNISVSTEHTETHIRCEAPPDITGAIFFLYYNRSSTHTKSTQAGTEERAVSFTVPRSSDSTLTYCCRYQFKRASTLN
uniref:C19orf38 Ig domain-containing protein n=1 Tax=Anguilla anguilla TaxID=7936 RepID=A0A0E9XUA7_ANGAN